MAMAALNLPVTNPVARRGHGRFPPGLSSFHQLLSRRIPGGSSHSCGRRQLSCSLNPIGHVTSAAWSVKDVSTGRDGGSSNGKCASQEKRKKIPALAQQAWPLLVLFFFSATGVAQAAVKQSIRSSSLGLRVAAFLRSSGWGDEAIVFTIAMLPVLELRGAVPIGYWLELDPVKGYLLAVLGNMVPVPLILLYLGKLSAHLSSRSGSAAAFFHRLFEQTRRKAGPIQEFKWLGLMLFVAVPFPGTGAWSGAIAASVLGMPFWNAMWANFLGVGIAGVLMHLLVSLGLRSALCMAALLFAASTFMWTLLRSLRSQSSSASS